jgi:ABC-type multidrug transport system fused ATPase/permease subunit
MAAAQHGGDAHHHHCACILYATVYRLALFGLAHDFGLPLNLLLARRRVPLGANAQRQDTRVRARVIDVLTNIGAVHEFAHRDFELKSLLSIIEDRYRAGLTNWRNGEFSRICSNLLQLAFVGGIMFTTIEAWSSGTVTAGDIVLVLALIGGLGYRMEELGREINDFAETYGEIQEGLEDLDQPARY